MTEPREGVQKRRLSGNGPAMGARSPLKQRMPAQPPTTAAGVRPSMGTLHHPGVVLAAHRAAAGAKAI